jgi:hypothetical protein
MTGLLDLRGSVSDLRMSFDQNLNYWNTIRSRYSGNQWAHLIEFLTHWNGVDQLLMQLRSDGYIMFHGVPQFLTAGNTVFTGSLHVKNDTPDARILSLTHPDPNYGAHIRLSTGGGWIDQTFARFTVMSGMDGVEREMWRANAEGWMSVAVPLILAADPTAPLHAATKQYVDNKTPTLPPEANANLTTDYGTTGSLGSYNSSFGAETQVGLSHSTIIGTRAACGPYVGNVSVGYGAYTQGHYAMAIGMHANALADGSLALGTNASGVGAQSGGVNSIVLGTPQHTVVVPGSAQVTGTVKAADPVAATDLTTKQYVDQAITVSTTAPSGAPARDGLLWVVAP